MLQNVISLDSLITTKIAHFFPHTWLFDSIFSFLSLQGVYIILWICGLAYLYVKDGKKRYREFIILLISLTITLLTVHFLKSYFQRPRPWTLLPAEDIRCYEQDYSFPSTHAAGSMCAAVIIASFHKKKKFWYFGLAFLIALSRIYWQCHYLLDVLFGASIGYLLGTLTIYVSTYSIEKTKDKKS